MCKRSIGVPNSGTFEEHMLVLDLLKETEWIPLNKDNYPKQDEWVLVSTKDGDIEKAKYSYVDWSDPAEFEWVIASGLGFKWTVRDVIAYRPLPSPYKRR